MTVMFLILVISDVACDLMRAELSVGFNDVVRWLNHSYLLKACSQNHFYPTVYGWKMKSLRNESMIRDDSKNVLYTHPSNIYEEFSPGSIKILLWNSMGSYSSLLRLNQGLQKCRFGPSLSRRPLPMWFPATPMYHYTSERMQSDQNTWGYVELRGLESMGRTDFGQKAGGRSEQQKSRSWCWSRDGWSL